MSFVPNDEQRQVVENLAENILLFASAGTGKTFTVAHRTAHILASGAARPEQILCLTFTIKAANEMRDDIRRIVGEQGEKVCVQTIHGFCYRLLKEEERLRSERYSDPQVIDEVDEETLLESIFAARAPEWKIADAVQKYNLKEGVEDLKTAPLVAYRGELGWAVDGGFLSRKGVFERVPAHHKWEKPQGECPYCKGKYSEGEEVCAACGKQLPALVGFLDEPTPPLLLKKKSPLMGIVTLIKHTRQEMGIYSESAAADYQAAWKLCKKHKAEETLRALSYFQFAFGGKDGGDMLVDEQMERALDLHAGELVAEYESVLAKSNQLDFDDLILRASRYLQDDKTRKKYAARYPFITVDEMQDTSLTEYALLKGIFTGNNVMLCGDFFQTIYAWRGSCPEQVLSDFQSEFTPTVYAFKENYRATKTLANATFGYLKNTYPALIGKYAPATLDTHSERDGEKIVCCGFDNLREEAAQIYEYVRTHRPQSPSELCIMARSNGYIANLTAAFERLNSFQKREEDKVRFFTVEKDHAFFKRACVKDILSILKLLVNPIDTVSMERIAGKYVRGVGAKSLQALRDHSTLGLSVSSFLNERVILGQDPYQVLIEAAKQGKIVVYDTETTGLDLSKDELVQLSAIRLDEQGEIADTLDMMVVPTVPISQGAYETHGFDLDYIRAHGGVDGRTALEKFSAFADGCVLVGHNSLRFDAPLLRRLFKEQGLPQATILGEYDTLPMAKLFLQGLADYKLSTLCARYGVVNEAAHNALGDITATGKVLWRMLQENVLPTASERLSAVEKYAPKFEKFFAFYRELSELLAQDRVGELVPRIIQRMALERFYPAAGDREAMQDVADSLRSVEGQGGERFLAEYLADAALSGSQMDVLLEKLQKIPVITVHQAKGCEFSTVILAGVNERFFPSSLSKGTPLEDEEKKVFYVAITRAKEKLILTRVTKDYKTGKHIPASPYVAAIPSEYVYTDRNWW